MTESTYLVECASCGAQNRVPPVHEGKHGRCGKCGETLPAAYAHPVSLGDEDFDRFLVENRVPVLAEFWAPW
ncbi:MAG TPA: hypothetical protein VNX25_07750 [Verrucomicrobiae bacterium]|nr:hypothetical protein [Verrucomicrobiae bacterium]